MSTNICGYLCQLRANSYERERALPSWKYKCWIGAALVLVAAGLAGALLFSLGLSWMGI
jgi:hypothetical protein